MQPVIVIAMILGLSLGATPVHASSTRMLIPLYSAPPGQWEAVASANTYRNIDVILNPNNGPGSSRQNSYVTGIALLRTENVGVLGYVMTGYGTRPLSAVKADIDNWVNWYAVNSIFLDETHNLASTIPYYTEIWNYIRSKSMTLIVNPGASTIEPYTQISDTICIYENDPSVTLTASAWATKYPASKFCALQYSASTSQMEAFLARAKSQNVGYVYVTNDQLDNPWDGIPPYLAQEAALLANYTTVSSPSPVSPLQGDLTGDGKVDLFDFRKLIKFFGNPYTLYHFKQIVLNYKK